MRLVAQVFGAVLKFGQAVEKHQIDFADGTVALLGHKQLRQTTQVLAIAPVVTGIVCLVLWIVDYLHLSLFQLNALAMLTVAGFVEFVSTLWVRNVVLQRGILMQTGPTSWALDLVRARKPRAIAVLELS